MTSPRTFGTARDKRELLALRDRSINFDPGAVDGPDWQFDEYRQPLPPEAPGEPVEGGSWRTAQRLLREYEFADPSRVRAVFDPDAPLEGRDMLLEIRFLGLRFDVGVRVGDVRDALRDVGGRRVRVWGWAYWTLEGHLEKGRMDYELWKWLDDGSVDFRIHRYSQPAPISNPLVALGFRLFGRREQVRFARRACERILQLTREEIGSGEGHDVRRVADALAAGNGDTGRP